MQPLPDAAIPVSYTHLPYLDQMPHFKEAYTEEYLEKCYVAGGMYMIAARPYIPYADYSIRRDWLDAVGMDVPTTLEELYDVLYACLLYTSPRPRRCPPRSWRRS